MSKRIVLTTGNADLNKLSGNVGFSHWFFNEFIDYADSTGTPYDHESAPLHIVLPVASVGDWQDTMLDQLEAIHCSRLHIEFQPHDHLGKTSDFFLKNANIYRKRIIDSLRERLDRSNWGHIIITGLTQDDCLDIIDLHLRLDVTVDYPVLWRDSVHEEVKTLYRRATIR